MPDSLDLLKALSDSVRLRIVRAVSHAELSVAELVQVLGLPQSTVSRHLKPLRDTGLVETRRDGTSIYYRRGPSFSDPILSQFVDEQVKKLAKAAGDGASVRRVLDMRKQKSRDFFDRIAGQYGSFTEPGGGWPALAAAMAAGFAGKQVADLGAGEGALTLILATFAAKVTAVDLSPEMLRYVTDKANEAGCADRVHTAEGDLESLPLPDACVDAAFLSQSLHHAATPERAVTEAARIIRPGGLLILLDLVKHEQEWVREEWADQWLGFDEDEVASWFKQDDVSVIHSARLSGSSSDLAVLTVVGRKESESINK